MTAALGIAFVLTVALVITWLVMRDMDEWMRELDESEDAV